MKLTVAMAMKGNARILPMNVVNSIVMIPIKDYIGFLTLTIFKSNVGNPIQSSNNKEIDQSAVE